MVNAIAPNAPTGAAYIRMRTMRNTTAVSVRSAPSRRSPRSPIIASATPNRIETSSTCRISPEVKALINVSGIMLSTKPVTVVSCALVT